mgnify:FL=1
MNIDMIKATEYINMKLDGMYPPVDELVEFTIDATHPFAPEGKCIVTFTAYDKKRGMIDEMSHAEWIETVNDLYVSEYES